MNGTFHPTDSELVAFARGQGDEKWTDHVSLCSDCQQSIEEITGVVEALSDIPDSPIPERTRDFISTLPRFYHQRFPWCQLSVLHISAKPVYLLLALIAVIICTYIAVIHVF